MRNIFTILLLLLVGSAFAQTSFVQSRFFGMPSVGNLIAGQCESCRPSEDGILEYRLGMVALESEGVNNTATYNIQMNIIGGNTNKVATRLAFASARLTYNTDAFGEKVIESGRCHQDSTPEASPFNGLMDYKYRLRDTTDNSFTITAHITTTTIAANRLVSIDGLNNAIFVRLSCAIQETDEDAGIAISGTDILSNMVYVYNDTNEMSTTISDRRNIFPLAGNDLLGFRSDGRTYAQRYALFSNGRGINIQFSQAVNTALQAGDFAISTDTVTITSVSHNAGEQNAVIEFDIVPPFGSELRFSDSAASIMSNSMALAAGNFIATLYYDADAPQATRIVRDSRDNSSRESRWTITFDKPLDPTTIEGNICLSNEDAYATCLTGNELSDFEANTAQILSVDHADTEPTTVTVVVAERVMENTTLTMSFRLNGVRGEDQRPVEEDQVALRGGVPIQDAQSPTITAQWVDSGGNAMSGNLVPDGTNYVIYFRITASENVPTLGNGNSYQLRRVIGGVASNTDGESVTITEVDAGREVILRYNVPVSGNANAEYFTVARNGATSLQDAAINQPIDDMGNRIADGGIISADARALRNTEGAQIGVQSATVMPANQGLRYIVTFETTSTEAVPTIANDASYSVTQQGSGVSPVTFDLRVNSDDDMSATITYEATFGSNQYDDVRNITGWRLDFEPGTLLDRDGNPPTIITAAADRTATRDRVSPIIRIFGTPTAARSSENPLIYEVTFDVRAANENVEGLDQPGSYLLYRDTTPISNLMPDIVQRSDNRQTTLTYTVLFQDIMDVRDTTNFRLHRNLATSLLDDSGNLPVDNNGNTIGANAEIDSSSPAVRPPLSNDRTLRGLQLTQSDGTAINLDRRFNPTVTTYTAIVAHDMAQVTVATTATDIGATVMINNSAAARSATTNVMLGAVGTTTTIAIIVTAEDGNTTQAYTVAVARQVPPIVLSDLVLSDTEGNSIDLLDLSDAEVQFDPATNFYNAQIVTNLEQTTVQVTATVEDAAGLTISIQAGTANPIGIQSGVPTDVPITFFTPEGPADVLLIITVERGGTINNYQIFLSRVDMDNPIITIATAPMATPQSDDPRIYDVVFVVEASENVPTLNSTNSYQLYRIEEDGENDIATLISGVGVIEASTIPGSDGMKTTLTYTVTLSNQQVTETDSFALYRSRNSDSLVDSSPNLNPPFNRSDTLIGTDTEIDPDSRAFLPSSVATLDALALTLSDGVAIDLNREFDSDVITYTAAVANDVTQVTVATTATDIGATVTVNNSPTTDVVLGGAGTTTTIAIIVTAEDRVTTQGYTVAVARAEAPELSDITTLSSLMLSDINGNSINLFQGFSGTDIQGFDPEVTNYNGVIASDSDQTTVTIVATAQDADGATIRLGVDFDDFNREIESGMSTDVAVTSFPEVISIRVIAANGIEFRTYNIFLDRVGTVATLSSLSLRDIPFTFDSGDFNYNVMVDNDIDATTVTTTLSDSNASVTSITANGSLVENGRVALGVGSNRIEILVTAEDGETMETYRITVRREALPGADATLSSLSLRDIPFEFISAQLNYDVTVANDIDATTVSAVLTDDNATIEVRIDEGDLVDSLDADIGLPVGDTEIAVKVIAANNIASQTYVIAITREANDVATLDSLSLRDIPLAFDSSDFNYDVTVANDIDATTVSAVLTDSDATIEVRVDEGDLVENLDADIGLPVGDTEIAVKVIAEDGIASQTYVIAITREASDVATLNSLSLRDIPLAFDSGDFNYDVTVANDIDATTVSAVLTDSDATIEVRVDEGDLVENLDADIGLPVGDTEIAVKVIAEDGIASQTYNIAITREANDVATLSSLSLRDIPLAFDSGDFNYDVTVANDIDATTVSAVLTDSDATIEVRVDEGDLVENLDADIGLPVGDTEIAVKVIAEDGIASQTYVIAITREASDVATLNSLSLRDIPLAFDSGDFNYDVTVANDIDATTVSAVLTDSDATIEVRVDEGDLVENLDADIELPVGDTEIAVKVIAEDGIASQTYVIAITREASDVATLNSLSLRDIPLAFDSGDFNYDVTVANDIDATTVSAVLTDSDATIEVRVDEGDLVENLDADIELPVGDTEIAVKVIAEDGIASQTYVIAITREGNDVATLSSLSLRDIPLAFDSNDFDYNVMVDNDIDATTVTTMLSDPNASVTSITANGSPVENGRVALGVGSNRIEILVTAEDGETMETYRITVRREALPGADATLSSLSLRDIPFEFISAQLNYDVTVANDIDATTVSAVLTDDNATIEVRVDEGDLVDSLDADIGLPVGDTEIAVKVIAANNIASQTYVIAITREANDVATLDSLSLRDIPLAFDSGDFNYDVTVANDIDATTVSAVLTDDNATIEVRVDEGDLVENLDADIGLPVGDTEIAVKVIAEDGIASQTYNIAITREANDVATLSSLSLRDIPLAFDSGDFNYDVTVANDIDATTVSAVLTDSDATIEVRVDEGDLVENLDADIGLPVGDTEIAVKVIAEDGIASQTYVIAITREASDVATLNSLSLRDIPLAFDSGDFNYDVTVANDIDATTVSAVLTDSDATIEVRVDEGDLVENLDADIELPVGDTEIAVKVIAEDGIASQTYVIAITREASDVATLNSLSLRDIPLAFDSGDFNYDVTVANDIDATTVSAVLTDSDATIEVRVDEGDLVENLDADIELPVGDTEIAVKVIAEDGIASQTYVIAITREASDVATLSSLSLRDIPLAFDSGDFNYDVTVANDIDATTVSAVLTDSDATIEVRVDEGDLVENLDADIELPVGDTEIAVKVIAENGIASQTYVIAITREGNDVATLSSLSLRDIPLAFDSNDFDYNVMVDNDIDATTVTTMLSDPNASVTSITANGSPVENGRVALGVGSNRIEILVTAEDGETMETYRITVRREALPGADATLSSLSLRDIPFEFISAQLNYDVTVANDIDATTVSAVLTDDNATIEVRVDEGDLVDSLDADIGLPVGDTEIAVKVIAANNIASQTYVIAITREANDVATLDSLSLRDIPLAFDSGDFNYDVTVANDIDATTVSAVLTDSDATIEVRVDEGDLVENLDADIGLPVGDTEIAVKVIAEDGIASQTYNIAITREANDVATLSSLSLRDIPLAFDSGDFNYDVTVANDIDATTVSAVLTDSDATIEVRVDEGDLVENLDADIGLPVGDTEIAVKVIAEDGIASQTYVIAITREASDVATLNSLSLRDIPLAFDSGDFNYDVTVANDIDATTVSAVLTDSDATIEVRVDEGDLVENLDADIGLPVGDTEIAVKVIAEDGIASQTYVIAITREASDVATLNSLSLRDIPLAFDSGDFNYDVTVANDIDATTVSAVLTDSDATIEVRVDEGDLVENLDADIELPVGDTEIAVKVIAEDGIASQTYVIAITREASDVATLSSLSLRDIPLAFDSGDFNYDVTVANDIDATTVSAVLTDSDATIEVRVDEGDLVENLDADIELPVGDTEIAVKVIAENGIASQTYVIAITREGNDVATLSSLSLRDIPLAFDSNDFDYNVMVDNDIDATTVTTMLSDPNASVTSITANGSPVENGRVALGVGSNRIEILVTAEDGETMETYRITVRREALPGADATLSSLSLRDIPFEFISAQLNYDVTVANDIDATTVSAVLTDDNATIEVRVDEGDLVDSLDADIGLPVGDTEIAVKVIAANNIASQTYVIAITREASDVATLDSLSLRDIPLAFDSGDFNYDVTVANDIDATTVSAVLTDSDATIEVRVDEGDLVENLDADIGLPVGDTEIAVKVIAEDGIASQTYNIAITREANDVATLSSLSLRDIPLAFDSGDFNYDVTVANDIDATTVSAVLTDSDATIEVRVDEGDLVENLDADIGLPVGDTEIAVKVIAEDGIASQTYVIAITREASDVATLNSLSLRDIPLAFDSGDFNYDVTVANDIDATTVSAVLTDSDATIEVRVDEGDLVENLDADIELPVGDTEIAVKVTAEDGIASQTYVIAITREASDVATLNSLSLRDIPLAFDSGDFNYDVTVANDIDATTVSAVLTDSDATIEVRVDEGDLVENLDADIELPVGDTEIAVKVIAENGIASQTYVIAITREASDVATLSSLSLRDIPLAFDSGDFNYDVTVANDIDATTVSAVLTDSDATIEVRVDEGDLVENLDADIELPVGDTEIAVKVIAEDGIASQTYVIAITREGNDVATLSSLSLRDIPLAFDSNDFDYNVMVDNDIDATTVTTMLSDPNASVTSITANGSPVENGRVALGVGSNRIEILVTAEDGETMETYRITVRREALPGADATLSSLSLRDIPFEFISAQLNYDVTVANDIDATTVSAVLTDDNATIEVRVDEGDLVENLDADIGLPVGDTEIAVKVIAEDGIASQTYVIAITREASDVATLSSLSLRDIPLAFDSGDFNYDVTVANDIDATTVSAVLTDDEATIEVRVDEGDLVENLDADIELPVGDTEIAVKVIAANGIASQTYVIAITREASDVATLNSLSLRDIPLAFDSGDFNYDVTVANDIDATTVSAVLTDSDATIEVRVDEGDLVENLDADIGLPVGDTEIAVKVIAEDGIASQTYVIAITREANDVATLNSLSLRDIPLAFDSGDFNYDVTVANDIDATTVSAVLTDSDATIEVRVDEGDLVENLDADIELPVGDTEIAVKVIAEDGIASQTYVIAITREASDVATLSSLSLRDIPLAFDSGDFNYDVTVANDIDATTVSAVLTDSDATIEVRVDEGDLVENLDADIELPVGDTEIAVKVIAEDGIASQTYVIAITREGNDVATLSSLSLRDIPLAFDSNDFDYNVMVDNDIDATTVTTMLSDPNASVTSITANASPVENGRVALGVGSNRIEILVTAEDGETMETYRITVRREALPGADATLSSLSLRDIPFEFISAQLNYDVTVANDIDATTVSAVLTDDNATIEVRIDEGDLVDSLDADIGLPVGDTEIAVKVIAANNIASQTYVIAITREANDVATLDSLSLRDIPLAFDSSDFNYDVTVANDIDATTVSAVLTDSDATIEVRVDEGDLVENLDADIGLPVGDTEIAVKVIAEDGIASQTYVIAITREASDVATLNSLSLRDIPLAFDSGDFNYDVTVANDIDATTVSAVLTDSDATIEVRVDEGDLVENLDDDIGLRVGDTEIAVKVIAENGIASQTYVIAITREGNNIATLSSLSLRDIPFAFDSGTFNYNVMVDNDIDATTVSAVLSDSNATIEVRVDEGEANLDDDIPLAEGETTTITIVVTAENGDDSETYTIAVERGSAGIRLRIKVFLEGPLQ